MSDDMRGRFVWYELLTTNPAAAQDFYTQVIGWSTQDWEGAEQPYTMWMADVDEPVGGVMELPDEAKQGGAPPHWMAYVSVPDVDQTLEAATANGASVVWGPMDVPEVGRMAGISDPQGAHLAIYTASGDLPTHEDRKTGVVSWHELLTTDYEAAFTFYSDLFGWQKTNAMDMGEMGVYQMYGTADKELGGMMNKPPDAPGPPFWMLYTYVDDLDAAVAKVSELGGQILNGPMDVPGGDRVAQCMDPQGAAFALHSGGGAMV